VWKDTMLRKLSAILGLQGSLFETINYFRQLDAEIPLTMVEEMTLYSTEKKLLNVNI
jgi:hypothetical protein